MQANAKASAWHNGNKSFLKKENSYSYAFKFSQDKHFYYNNGASMEDLYFGGPAFDTSGSINSFVITFLIEVFKGMVS